MRKHTYWAVDKRKRIQVINLILFRRDEIYSKLEFDTKE